MKVLIWACGFEQRYAGPYLYEEAKRQKFEVEITGSRNRPREMLNTLYRYKPDIVFCFAIRPDFKAYYDAIKNTGAKLVLWYPDMTEHRRDRMWRRYLKNIADILIFSILETAQRYQHLAPTVLWMPQYFDHHFCSRNGKLPQRLNPEKPIYDIGFIGSCDKLRNNWLDELEKHYNCFFARDGIRNKRELRGWDMAEIYAQSRITINIQREMFINPGPYVTSNRIYNAIGSGAFYITHRVDKLELVFTENYHCVMHNDTLTNLRYLIDYYLKHDTIREKIAAQGQQHILQYHTLEQRVKEYWYVMKLLYNGAINKLKPGAYGKWYKTGDGNNYE